MAEKKCKFCATMIPAEAKICPNCRKRQGISFVQAFFFIIIVLILLKVAINHETKQASIPASSVPEISVPEIGFLTTKGKKLKAKHPSWTDAACNAIAEKKVFVGMNKEQAIAAWGEPYDINTTTTASHVREQWVMHNYIGTPYLYFDDGVLTTIQNSK